MAERGFLEHLDADCKTPLAASASFDNENKIRCKYFLSNESFSFSETLEQTFDLGYCYEASVEVAKKMALKIPDYKVKL